MAVRSGWMRRATLAALCVVSAVQALASPSDAAALIDAAEVDAQIVVLGELHGTHEAPAVAAALAGRRLDAGLPVTLAVEIYTDEQPRIDAYLASAGAGADRAALLEGPFWAIPIHRNDGRRSVATLALIESARQRVAAGADLRVLAFDARNAGGGAHERNRRMAAVLRAAISEAPERAFVVLIGNYHARRAAPDRIGGLSPGESPPIPTMAHLADLPMLRVNVTAEAGEHWTCSDGVCGPRRVGGNAEYLASGHDAEDSVESLRFVARPHDAARWDAQLILPRYSVAEPAVRAPAAD